MSSVTLELGVELEESMQTSKRFRGGLGFTFAGED